MRKGWIVNEDEQARRAQVLSTARQLTNTSYELATQADGLSEMARTIDGRIIDLNQLEAQLGKVRRDCAEVQAEAGHVINLTNSHLDQAEFLIKQATQLFDAAEDTFNQASFEVNYATP